MIAAADLQHLRAVLAPLAESVEVEPDGSGLLAWIPVVGGTFVHPLDRQPITRLRVYGAGPDRVKILEPRFMRTLPTVPILGLQHPSQLCAAVARMLGEALGELGRIREAVAAMGIFLDLDHDVLQLRGQVDLQGIRVELTSSKLGCLVIASLGSHPMADLDRTRRTLELTGQAPEDLDLLAKLVRKLDDEIRRETLDQLERSLGLLEETGQDAPGPLADPVPAAEPAPALMPTTGADLGSGWGEVLPLVPLVRVPEPTPLPQPVPQSAPALEFQPEPLPQASPADASQADSDSGDIVELVDLLEEEPASFEEAGPAAQIAPVEPLEPVVAAEPVAEPGSVVEPGPADGFPPVRIKALHEVAGGETEISAHQGRLRLRIPFRVVQGQFTFYLEQVGQKRFTGFLVSATGARHKVDVDFGALVDIKEVFDRVMLGR